MAALVESLTKTGRLEVDIKVTADVNVSAYAARQKVNDFVLSDVSCMMHADAPTLVLGERICWRVPVILSLTSQGDVGEVGTIDVDVETGQMHVTPIGRGDQRPCRRSCSQCRTSAGRVTATAWLPAPRWSWPTWSANTTMRSSSFRSPRRCPRLLPRWE